jgi:hypothetical protein
MTQRRGPKAAKWRKINQAMARELFACDPETGALTWRISQGRSKAGTEAGWLDAEGVRLVGINGEIYPAAAIVQLWRSGRLPDDIGPFDAPPPTPEQLRKTAQALVGKAQGWENRLAQALGVRRWSVMRWLNGAQAMQEPVRRHLETLMRAKKLEARVRALEREAATVRGG